MNLQEMMCEIHDTAVVHGWWESRNIPEKLCLIHSEVSEALEDFRDGKMQNEITETGKPEGFPVELADAVIRILDLCGHLGIDLEKEILRKMAYNKTRPYRHGNKLA